MSILEIVFWIALAGSVYVYVGYPAMVYVAAKLLRRGVARSGVEPTVSILIAAYNERAHIGQTIANKLALDYPPGRLEVVVVSDGSTDGTDDIVRSLAFDRVTLMRQEPRNGKTAALNRAVERATGEVLVFADANSLYERSALRHLVANFADPRVGYVTGKLRYANPDGSMTGDGCGAYMRYENFVRTCETGVGSLVGVNGGIDAVRRSLYEPMHPDDLPDLVLPLKVVERGYRVVFDPEALLTETANATSADEYRMRVRVSLRALWTLAEMRSLLNPFRYGFFAVQLLSHKVLRYLAFVFIVLTLVTSALLWPHGVFFQAAFVAHLLVAFGAMAGYLSERSGRSSRLFYIPYFFVLINLAALQAFVKFLRGERHRVWRPRLG